MSGHEFDANVGKGIGERPGWHEEERGGRGGLMGLAKWGLD